MVALLFVAGKATSMAASVYERSASAWERLSSNSSSIAYEFEDPAVGVVVGQ
jgi:hypothetical protein